MVGKSEKVTTLHNKGSLVYIYIHTLRSEDEKLKVKERMYSLFLHGAFYSFSQLGLMSLTDFMNPLKRALSRRVFLAY